MTTTRTTAGMATIILLSAIAAVSSGCRQSGSRTAGTEREPAVTPRDAPREVEAPLPPNWDRVLRPQGQPAPLPVGDPALDLIPGEHFPRLRTYDVRHYRIECSIDFEKKTICGTVTITLTPLGRGFERFELDASEMRISAVSLESVTPTPSKERPSEAQSEPPRGFAADATPPPPAPSVSKQALAFVHSDPKLAIDCTAVTTPLGRGFGPQDTLTVSVAWSATPRKGLYFVGPNPAYPDKPVLAWTQGEPEDNHYWVPCYDYPNDRATSETLITVPEGYRAVSNGKFIGSTSDPNAKTVTWRHRESVPHVAYLLSIVAGDLVEFKDQWKEVPLLYYVSKRDADEGTVKRSFANTADIMECFSARFGTPYPYEKYAQVVVYDFIYGGMENISATTLTRSTLHDARAHGDALSEGLVAHELAHQWWGDLLTCRDWSHIWLNEGFATYAEAVYYEHWKGADEYRRDMAGCIGAAIGEDRWQYRRPIVHSWWSDPDDMFDTHTYQKGGSVLHMLRFVLGDEAFWKGIAKYAQDNRGKCVVTDDLKRAMEDSSGQDLGWFFDQWLHKAGHPEYKVRWEWDEPGKIACVIVTQAQKTDAVTPLFRMPVEIRFLWNDRDPVTRRVMLEGKEQRCYFPCEAKPGAVQFDPAGWLLKTLEFGKSKEEWLCQAKRAAEALGRQEAVGELGRQGGDDSAAACIEALTKDGDYGVRTAAAGALGALKGDKSRDALLGALAEEKDSRVREDIARALGNFGEDPVLAALTKALNEDASYSVRSASVEALLRAAPKKARETIEAALAQDSHHEWIRNAGLRGLADHEGTRALELFAIWARYGGNPHSRGTTLGALARLGKGNREVEDLILSLIDDPDFGFRRQVFGTLADLGRVEAVAPLKRHAETEFDARMRAAAARAARKILQAQPAYKVASLLQEARKLEKQAEAKEAEIRKATLQIEDWRLEARKKRLEAEQTPIPR
ncbi:MAG: HEAT repeat domain-containing protein [Planctomycetes bacterium]|nr:HEAT repeat domain-containing protein [Planctomycetota bacterium]